MRVFGCKGFPAFEGAVADEEDRTFGQFGGKAVRIDDDGLRFRQLAAVRRENGGIDLHPAGIHHRHDVSAAFRNDAQAVRFADEGIQRADGQEGKSGTEAEPLGRGNPDAESRVGTRPLAHAYGIQVLDRQSFFIQDFLDERCREGGLHAGFSADAGGRHDAVLRNGGGELGGRCFYQKDAGHAYCLKKKAFR